MAGLPTAKVLFFIGLDPETTGSSAAFYGREVEMLRYARFPATRLFAVEVSGWDSAQNFFVEKCDLVWNEESGKRVALKRQLRENTLLFVRLLQSSEADRSHPVVYQAELIGAIHGGVGQFRLHAVTPRVQEMELAAV